MDPSQLPGILAESDPVLLLDTRKDKVLYQNAMSRDLFDELTSMNDLLALSESDEPGLSPGLCLKTLIRLRGSDGVNAYWMREIPQDENWILVLYRVGQMESELEELCRGQELDPLSHCLNRRAILYSLVREMARAQRGDEPFQLMLLGLRGLEVMPEDRVAEVLPAVAELVQATIRQTDVLGRYEHDEFILLLPATDHEGGIWVAQRTWRMLRASPLEGLDVELDIGISGQRNGDSPQDMIERARQARLNVLFGDVSL